MEKQSLYLPEIIENEDKSSDIKNCIRNNYRHLRKWAKRTTTDCFRIYDRDIKAYPLAIDIYGKRFLVQYFSSSRDFPDPSTTLMTEIENTLASLFGCKKENVYWRTRIRRKQTEQYEKRDNRKEFYSVTEYGAKFYVNLVDYLDTGLFLDHRETRQRVASYSKGKSILNLFAYTCSFSLHAALADATSTKSVDLSNTYLNWGQENFRLNGIPLDTHEFVREDCVSFLENEVKQGVHYDLIVIDPPTLSRSKKMTHFFDIQHEYVNLISKSLSLLSPQGIVIFSTNSRKFDFDTTQFPSCKIEEITQKTIPLDFRSKKIHSCWKISTT